MEQTTYSNKCQILADLWTDYRDDDQFRDFIEYNDLGLPLAYSVANGIVENNQIVEGFVNETFRLLIVGLEIEDEGFQDLNDILG